MINALLENVSKWANSCHKCSWFTFNNISVISWWSVLLVEETGENRRPVASLWQTWIVSSMHIAWAGFEPTTIVVINPTIIRSRQTLKEKENCSPMLLLVSKKKVGCKFKKLFWLVYLQCMSRWLWTDVFKKTLSINRTCKNKDNKNNSI